MRPYPGTPFALAALGLLAAPAAAQWSTDTLQEARVKPGATSVGGLSLFAGGFGGVSVLDTVEVYEHSSGGWLPPMQLSVARQRIGAATAGGKAFFAGGDNASSTMYDTVDVYDPVAGWSVMHLSQARTFVGAAAHGGKVYFAGGAVHFQTVPQVTDLVDVYDTATDSWSVLHLSVPRADISVVVAGDRILFAGGSDGLGTFDVVDVYDTSTDTWLPPAQLSAARIVGGGVSQGGVAVFAGGQASSGSFSDAVDLYDANTGSWSTATLSAARASIMACAHENRLLFAGGYTFHETFDEVDVYDVGTGLWSMTALSQARGGGGATAVGGRALFASGQDHVNSLHAVVDVFEPLGTRYCTATPNSTGDTGSISAMGSALAASNDVTLIASDVPSSTFGFFITSQAQGLVSGIPNNQGNLCVDGSIGRFVGPGQVMNAGVGGTFTLTLDLNHVPTPTGLVSVMPGETWNFQAWYRDANPMPTSNFTDAVSIAFQ